ncbi:Asp23/Gls24 family envelope stress response protein [Actinomadura xylanilytica]|uniref:Asp23/Gls24 family envelope stress response protein n=1 Tax=Actinomadura xylanilytica TaxID=887459 RepID=UPI00255ABCEB|nr:Asp23/Gls24 family envelope stress response protein [Actinomadura xylanilytica]MDL4777304.1 Asp23/Gls24 family envelope stress response protein [Actinomadura xylanilytica]
MPELDKAYTGTEPPQPEPRSMPFFPGPAGGPGGAPPPAGPATSMPPGPALPSGLLMPPVPAPAGRPSEGGFVEHPGAPSEHASEQFPPEGGTGVGGRITIEDAVIEKIATLAALEARGVVALTGRDGRTAPGGGGGHGGGAGRGPEAGGPVGAAAPEGTGVRIQLLEHEVSITLGVVVEYGSVIMEVAEAVKANVARVVGLMLGMRVAAVNVAVEDVRA